MKLVKINKKSDNKSKSLNPGCYLISRFGVHEMGKIGLSSNVNVNIQRFAFYHDNNFYRGPYM